MNNVNFDLLNNQNEREIIMSEERLDTLDKVKELVMLKGTEYMTTEMVANYYNVPEGTIRTVIRRNKEELIKNGFNKYSKDEILRMFHCETNVKQERTRCIIVIDGEKIIINNTGLNLFNKRSVLNIGMLLEGSPIAEQVRTLLLDNHEQLIHIHDKLKNGEEITKEDIDKSDPLYFEKKEKELRQQELDLKTSMSDAIIAGDVVTLGSISGKLSNIKEKLIALEKERNELNKPKITYYDMVLKSEGLIPITSIAKDYGMSGQAFNKLLHDLGVQYKQGKQWLLYSDYDNLGWTQSETYCNGDNSYLHTKWTQKGRLGLYELLKSKNILPTIEKEQQII